jgi:signal transduction histidine kinase
MSAVRPPDAADPLEPAGREPVRLAPAQDARRGPVPQSFQTRLTIAFMGVVALTLLLVAPTIVLRMDGYFRTEEERQLADRTTASVAVLMQFVEDAAGSEAVVVKQGGRWELNPAVETMLREEGGLQLVADHVAQATVKLAFGPAYTDTDGMLVTDPRKGLTYDAETRIEPDPGQAVDKAIPATTAQDARLDDRQDWGLVVTLSDPYTTRAATIGAINGLLLIMAAVALILAVLVASFLAHRFATPLTRLTAATRRLAGGDFSSRVALDEITTGTLEIRSVTRQFNVMAARLEESVEVIRRDRDRSRDFLADVSHELRTPIAAMRTFVELLQGPAGDDPAARAEFLESSAGQLDRLDWLAQNLLELSKLDSGLVLLELRPDDLRGTIESAVEQQLASAERRGVRLVTQLPDRPLRFQHDSPRVGQVVANLVGNAIKFTPRGGEVHVMARAEADGGARIEVVDSGIGIKEAELPLIFDRFYRGSQSNEARGSGSGLGLSIVKSIVDMHHGTIAVESAVGRGTRFVVTFPRDPRDAVDVAPPEPDEVSAWPPPTPPVPKVEVSSPTATPPVNPDAALLTQEPAPGASGNPLEPESPARR